MGLLEILQSTMTGNALAELLSTADQSKTGLLDEVKESSGQVDKIADTTPTKMEGRTFVHDYSV